MYYINYFFLFSIFGHILESFFYSSGDSGILLGWWTPVYGIGSIFILIVYKWISKIKINNILKIPLIFVCSAVILAIIEAMGGYLIKWIFDKELWNYSNHKFNIGKYTSLEMSLLWGLSSVLLIYFIKPLSDKIVSKIPKILTYILVGLFFIDCISTIIVKIL